jgi:hypothetical protein
MSNRKISNLKLFNVEYVLQNEINELMCELSGAIRAMILMKDKDYLGDLLKKS